MATYLIRKDKLVAIEWTGSNLTEVQDFVANLPELDDFYSQFTGVSVTQAGGTLNISTNETGNVGFNSGALVGEGAVSSGVNLVYDATVHPAHFRIEV